MRSGGPQLELNVARNAKDKKQGFYRYVSQKRKVKHSVFSLFLLS